jgi:diaminohydroxyphosphoribosylaminopyrimidine deaminase/5-amino-6-(5-phosphoribosylamino)uracil reductase
MSELENNLSQYLERAIELAEKSKPESGKNEEKKVHPKVGCVIIKDNQEIASACRNEYGDGDHAESTALRKCSQLDLRDAILITTLEPCTIRKHDWLRREYRRSCLELILHFGIKKVIIGILDPNPAICCCGYYELIKRGVSVEFFPGKLQERILALNREYISYISFLETVKKYKDTSILTNFFENMLKELKNTGLTYYELATIINIYNELLRRFLGPLLI